MHCEVTEEHFWLAILRAEKLTWMTEVLGNSVKFKIVSMLRCEQWKFIKRITQTLTTPVCSCASWRNVRATWTPKRSCFAFYLWEHLNNVLTAVSSIWISGKRKANDTVTTQYMILVRAPYHQPNVYFCPRFFCIIWHQLGNLCTKFFCNATSHHSNFLSLLLSHTQSKNTVVFSKDANQVIK